MKKKGSKRIDYIAPEVIDLGISSVLSGQTTDCPPGQSNPTSCHTGMRAGTTCDAGEFPGGNCKANGQNAIGGNCLLDGQTAGGCVNTGYSAV